MRIAPIALGVLLCAAPASATPITVSIAGSFTSWTESANWALPGLQTDPTFTGWITFDILGTSPVNWVEVFFEVSTAHYTFWGWSYFHGAFSSSLKNG